MRQPHPQRRSNLDRLRHFWLWHDVNRYLKMRKM
jgi:hypothetical protein